MIGLAIATSLSAWLNVALLAGTLVREHVWAPSARFVGRMTRVLAATGAMAAVLVAAGVGYETLIRLLLAKEVAVLVVCGAGAVVYGAALLLFRAVTVAELKAVLRREPGASVPSALD